MHAEGPQPAVILVPGLGADARLFGRQRAVAPDLYVPPWFKPEPQETLGQYAARMAAALNEPDRPYVLGGASFGGMVALEMSRRLRPCAVVLIGSALSGSEVRAWLRAIERVGHPLPTAMIDACRSFAPLLAPVVSSGSRVDLGLFLDMLRETPTDFIRWASRAIMRWRWEGQIDCPVYRLHGARDRIIRPPRADGATTLIGGAGHVVSLSHPEETNRFLHGVCARHGVSVAPQTAGGTHPR